MVLEGFAAVNKDHRYVVPMLGFPLRIFLYVSLDQVERELAGGLQDGFLGLVAQMASGTRIDFDNQVARRRLRMC